MAPANRFYDTAFVMLFSAIVRQKSSGMIVLSHSTAMTIAAAFAANAVNVPQFAPRSTIALYRLPRRNHNSHANAAPDY